jgi:acyl-coenzyme A thioesterase 9
MATRTAAARLLSARLIPRASARAFTWTIRPCYDGVYEELRLMKLQKPWLQALKERNAGIEEPVAAPQQQELVPKRMKDSYHELVSPLPNLPARPALPCPLGSLR